MKCAIAVPFGFTFHPAIARPKPAAQIPRFAAPEPTPLRLIATAIPTVVNGETINIQKITANNKHMMTGCNDNSVPIPCPNNVVKVLMYGKARRPAPPTTTNNTVGITIIEYALALLPIHKMTAAPNAAVSPIVIMSPVPLKIIPFTSGLKVATPPANKTASASAPV